MILTEMNTELYRKAKRYAYKLNSKNFMDIVHDSYVRWYDKTGKDLFDEKEGTVLRVIRNVCYGQSQKDHFMFDGKFYPKQYISSEFILGSTDTETEYIIEELKKNFEKSLSRKCLVEHNTGQILTIYGLVKEGYKNYEIAEKLGISRTLVTYYTNQLKK